MEEALEKLALEAVESPADDAGKNEPFDVLDYVRELFLNSEEQKKLERKKLRLMRVAVSLAGVVAFVVVLSAAILLPMLITTISEANKTLVSVQQVDIQKITTNIDALAVQATDTFDSVGEAVLVLNDLDMESLNSTIAELKTGVESFSKLDIETLNTAIANLNATVEPLARLFGKK
jgi:hypothetical protein